MEIKIIIVETAYIFMVAHKYRLFVIYFYVSLV